MGKCNGTTFNITKSTAATITTNTDYTTSIGSYIVGVSQPAAVSRKLKNVILPQHGEVLLVDVNGSDKNEH